MSTRCRMHCPTCHNSFVVRGWDEPDVNAFTPNEEDLAERQEAMGCLHEDSYVVEVDYEED